MIHDPYESWAPNWVDIDTSQGVATVLTDEPPEDMPLSRPILGFK